MLSIIDVLGAVIITVVAKVMSRNVEKRKLRKWSLLQAEKLRGKGSLKQLPHQVITPSVTDLNLPFWNSWRGVKQLLVYDYKFISSFQIDRYISHRTKTV